MSDAKRQQTRWFWWVIGFTAIGAATAGVTAIIAVEASMSPTAAERRMVTFVVVAVAVTAMVVSAIGALLSRRSLGLHLAFSAVVAPLFLALAIAFGVSTLYVSEHDRDITWVLVGLSAALSIVLSIGPAFALRRDLRNLRTVVDQLSRGRRDVDAAFARSDDLGHVGTSVERLAQNLTASEQAQEASEHERSIMLAALGHDLRTPLTSMRAALEAIVDDVSPDPDRYLSSSLRDLTTVENMVEDIFLLGRIEAGRLEVSTELVDLSEVVDGVTEAMQPLADSKDAMLEAITPGRVLVRGATHELGRVLRNLVDNAVRHSPVGGLVSVSIVRKKAIAELVVRDQGDGFPPDFCDEAFGTFTRADEARTGSGAGLGLAIAAGIVESLDGQIWAEPGPGGVVKVALETTPV